MTTKKRSTKAPEQGKPDAELEALAYHLAEAFRIMGASDVIPSRVYNNFADAMNDTFNLVNADSLVHSAAYIRLHIMALAGERGAR